MRLNLLFFHRNMETQLNCQVNCPSINTDGIRVLQIKYVYTGDFKSRGQRRLNEECESAIEALIVQLWLGVLCGLAQWGTYL